MPGPSERVPTRRLREGHTKPGPSGAAIRPVRPRRTRRMTRLTDRAPVNGADPLGLERLARSARHGFQGEVLDGDALDFPFTREAQHVPALDQADRNRFGRVPHADRERQGNLDRFPGTVDRQQEALLPTRRFLVADLL